MDNKNNTVTFVTNIFHIYEKNYHPEKTIEWRINNFKLLAQTGINICLYVCDIYKPLINDFIAQYSNVKIIELNVPYIETQIYKLCQIDNLELPYVRNNEKDTKEYISLMNCKIEFVNDAIKKNPFNNNVFSWIDFSIAYLFKNKNNTLKQLENLGKNNYVNTFLAIPGCYTNKLYYNDVSNILNNVNWRFCGSFFIGDKESIINFYNLYIDVYKIFVEKYKKLIWEVNIWAYMEATYKLPCIWYLAGHNDSIINIPNYLYN